MELSRELAVGRLARWRRRELPGDGLRRSAVAVTVTRRPDTHPGAGTDQGIWVARRPSTMRNHAGQFALPGGRLDPGETVQDAALRELQEEFGIRLGPESVIGMLDDFATRSGYLITPIVCWSDAQPQVRPNPDEVEQAFFVTLEETAARPTFDLIEESDRPVIRMPIIGRWVHAPTAAIIHQFGEVVVRGRGVRVSDLEQPLFAWR